MARGWCSTHYARWWRHGDPLAVKTVVHVVQHGTFNEYGNFGCRCDECKRASFEYQSLRRKTRGCSQCGEAIWDRRESTGLCRTCFGATRRIAEHGTLGAYKRGCRCEDCRTVSAAAKRAYRVAHRAATRAYDREYKRRVRQAA